MVIPCYNEEAYLAKTLESLRAQTYQNFEIIVVDNNCTDHTVDIAKRYGARVVKETTPGVCTARQAGSQAAKGEIIISTDADTRFTANWLEVIAQSFSQHPDQVAVCGPCRYYDGPWWKVYTYILFSWSWLHYRLVGWPAYITATNTAFKKSAWAGYDTSLTQGGDELALLHQLRRRGRVRFNPYNAVQTSARRLEQGMLYSIFVTFLFYYLAGYYINKAFGREIIGMAPAFRKRYQRAPLYQWFWRLALLLVISLPVVNLYHGAGNRALGEALHDLQTGLVKLF